MMDQRCDSDERTASVRVGAGVRSPRGYGAIQVGACAVVVVSFKNSKGHTIAYRSSRPRVFVHTAPFAMKRSAC